MARRKGQRDDLRRRGDRKFCCGLAPPRIGSDGELLRFAQPEATLRNSPSEPNCMKQQRGAMGAFLMRQRQPPREHSLVRQHDRSS